MMIYFRLFVTVMHMIIYVSFHRDIDADGYCIIISL